MTNRMIDADKLLDWISDKCITHFQGKIGSGNNIKIITKNDIVNKINELATPVEPQESIFDAEGWCSDMLSVPLSMKVKVKIEVDDELHIKTNTFEKPYIENGHHFKYLAWRPLPTLPKEA